MPRSPRESPLLCIYARQPRTGAARGVSSSWNPSFTGRDPAPCMYAVHVHVTVSAKSKVTPSGARICGVGATRDNVVGCAGRNNTSKTRRKQAQVSAPECTVGRYRRTATVSQCDGRPIHTYRYVQYERIRRIRITRGLSRVKCSSRWPESLEGRALKYPGGRSVQGPTLMSWRGRAIKSLVHFAAISETGSSEARTC